MFGPLTNPADNIDCGLSPTLRLQLLLRQKFMSMLRGNPLLCCCIEYTVGVECRPATGGGVPSSGAGLSKQSRGSCCGWSGRPAIAADISAVTGSKKLVVLCDPSASDPKSIVLSSVVYCRREKEYRHRKGIIVSNTEPRGNTVPDDGERKPGLCNVASSNILRDDLAAVWVFKPRPVVVTTSFFLYRSAHLDTRLLLYPRN